MLAAEMLPAALSSLSSCPALSLLSDVLKVANRTRRHILPRRAALLLLLPLLLLLLCRAPCAAAPRIVATSASASSSSIGARPRMLWCA